MRSTSRALIAANIVASVLLLVAVGILVSLLLDRANDEGVEEPPSVSRSTEVAGSTVVTEDAEDDAGDGAPSQEAPRLPSTSDADLGPTSGVMDGAIDGAPDVTYDFGAPPPEGELATALSSLTSEVRRCTTRDESYRPRNVSVQLIRSSNNRVRVSAIEPDPPQEVGACITRLVHRATADVVATESSVLKVYDLQ